MQRIYQSQAGIKTNSRLANQIDPQSQVLATTMKDEWEEFDGDSFRKESQKILLRNYKVEPVKVNSLQSNNIMKVPLRRENW